MKKTSAGRREALIRLTLGLPLGAAWCASHSGRVAAQAPARVRLLVGFPAGAGSDAIARILAEPLREQLGVPVIVENRAGAGGQLAAQALKAAEPDGGTLFVSHDHTISILPLFTADPGFDPAKDFVPVAGFASFVNAFALSASTPARSFAEYVAWIKRNGGKGSVGIAAPASVLELVVGSVADHFKLDLVAAPYRGSAPMISDMLGGQIPAGLGSTPDFIEQHRAGKVRIVAALGPRRQPALPDVPTFAELGLAGFEAMPYFGVFAPAGTPPATVERLANAVREAIARSGVRDRLTGLGLNVEFSGPAAFAKRVADYSREWAAIAAKRGVKAVR